MHDRRAGVKVNILSFICTLLSSKNNTVKIFFPEIIPTQTTFGGDKKGSFCGLREPFT